MKSRLISLAALLMASAATGALAQTQPQIENGGPMWNAGQQAKARQAQGQPAQQPPPEHGPHRPQQAPPPPQAGQPPQQPGRPGGPPQNWNRPDNGRPANGGDRQHWAPGQPGPDHRDRDRYDRDRDYRDRYDRDHRDDGRRDWDRDGGGPDWDRHDRGPPPNAPRWAPRRYPPIYSSPSRYQAPYWRPPEGFYVRAWRYGEVLPRGWYGPDYRLFDWWSFDLPAPPPGFEWVRVGRDALLVDYSGRIFQVVRAVFW